ncbi:MAG: exodeoxyribonuclease III [Rhodobacteraceae bacterium]|nr:exodeoxyribonuclease III [Paracoccaceae bacterium]
MQFTVATWNINSIRLRESLVCKFLNQYTPDILCLQEIKSPTELVGTEAYRSMGYNHILIRGQKAYNGVAILSRIPMVEVARINFIDKEEARHISARLENGITIENCYVPAGGDVPDPEENPKFKDKLDFIAGMKQWSINHSPKKTILVGDLNIAPFEDDVWSHRQLLKVVSHTPVEVEGMTSLMKAGGWIDTVRANIPEGKLYSWWSYRARNWDISDRGRRLDHIWASSDLASNIGESVVLREIRGWERPSDHVPVMTKFII